MDLRRLRVGNGTDALSCTDPDDAHHPAPAGARRQSTLCPRGDGVERVRHRRHGHGLDPRRRGPRHDQCRWPAHRFRPPQRVRLGPVGSARGRWPLAAGAAPAGGRGR
ncbi:hypothetical protein G6F59_018337 [Rhizopus arrhizus]|nr:hypothetical protein G6F59_018337 [Rhizopus arrhizus]